MVRLGNEPIYLGGRTVSFSAEEAERRGAAPYGFHGQCVPWDTCGARERVRSASLRNDYSFVAALLGGRTSDQACGVVRGLVFFRVAFYETETWDGTLTGCTAGLDFPFRDDRRPSLLK